MKKLINHYNYQWEYSDHVSFDCNKNHNHKVKNKIVTCIFEVRY